MTIEEYNMLNGINNFITVDELKNKKDRVLIYGYTLERQTFIIRLQDGKFIKTIGGDSKIIEHNSNFIPDKRVYPAESDYEFCSLLLSRGVFIPFTTFE